MGDIFFPKADNASLANSVVLTEKNEQIKLGRLWQSKPCIFVFLRHFACIACRAHAKEVWDKRQQYEKKGNLIFVGNGDPQYITEFRKSLGLQQALILTDPSLFSFRAAGFRHGFFYVVQFPSVVNIVKMTRKGHKQVSYTKKAGTHWQMGGILVVNTDGEIIYQYISESMGDFPEEPHFDKIITDEKERPPTGL